MKDFMLLFRQPSFDHSKTSPQDLQAIAKKWHNWIDSVASQGRLVNRGQRLALEGKVLKPGGVVTDGPFVEIRERLGSFVVVKAHDLDDATTLAHGCPVLDEEGSVEIRPVFGS